MRFFSVCMVALGVAILGCQPVYAACMKPAPPPVPDARNASEEDMVSALQETRAFQNALDAYRECLHANGWQDDSVAGEEKQVLDAMNTQTRIWRQKKVEIEAATVTTPLK